MCCYKLKYTLLLPIAEPKKNQNIESKRANTKQRKRNRESVATLAFLFLFVEGSSTIDE